MNCYAGKPEYLFFAEGHDDVTNNRQIGLPPVWWTIRHSNRTIGRVEDAIVMPARKTSGTKAEPDPLDGLLQIERFRAVARELECDEDEDAFKRHYVAYTPKELT